MTQGVAMRHDEADRSRDQGGSDVSISNVGVRSDEVTVWSQR